jgi:heme/copper-type cytochrome/quinol oxidase subunit 2
VEVFGFVIPIIILYGITRFIVFIYENWYEIKPTGQYKQIIKEMKDEKSKF